ncbi:[weak similarity to] 1-deoxy-D-xylulose5-phosphate reductoisomerase_ [Bathymodiolus azoricus thioautotrophic gill symbiont]|nr:[weak similarity to] 1-deoxy-D-xylulose5-phosphate reductoisomerase_ [Bathymodiolus azoricus thioautotrophic gill symbiont]
MGTLNAANEVAVEHFLNNKISFLDITKVIQHTLDTVQHTDISSLEAIIANDTTARETARAIIKKYA